MASRKERTEDLSKDMKIYVSDAHIFTSDAIVLADFCGPRHKDKCCDLGTGNGIIPMLWLRDFQPKEITGVELSESAVALFNKTLEENGLTDKVNIVHCDLRNLKGVLPNEYYDLVSINPPYKKLGTGIVNEGEDYKNARHEFNCTLEDAAKAASSKGKEKTESKGNKTAKKKEKNIVVKQKNTAFGQALAQAMAGGVKA